MGISEHHLVAGAIGLGASLAALGIAGALILKRPESASLFVEDRIGYFIVRIMGAAIFAAVGIHAFCRSLEFLFAA